MTPDTPFYRWGDVLSFRSAGNGGRYCVSGWAQPEADFTWTDGPNARLALMVRQPDSDVSMAFKCIPNTLGGRIPYQEINLFINFLRLACATATDPGEIVFEIPRRVLMTPHLIIDFYLPKAASPGGNDLRRVGIALESLTLTEIPRP